MDYNVRDFGARSGDDLQTKAIQQAIDAGCDTFVTSDLRYHEFLDTQEINLIDAGHFPTENIICPVLSKRLREAFPSVTVVQTTAHSREVIQYCIKGE